MLWKDIDYSKYELFLIDLWGTIHDGIKPYKGAIEQLQFLKENNKKVIFLTNTDRIATKTADFLNEIGITRELYDNIVSSGEVFLYDIEKNKKFKDKKVFNIGEGSLKQYKCNIAEKIEDADFLTLSGSIYPLKEEYFEALSYAKHKKMKVLCLNPDFFFFFGNFLEPQAGFLANYYEHIGGEVIFYGKPFKRIYEYALEIAKFNDKSKIIAIGDNIKTDIKGAKDFGIDSYYVKTGMNSN